MLRRMDGAEAGFDLPKHTIFDIAAALGGPWGFSRGAAFNCLVL